MNGSQIDDTWRNRSRIIKRRVRVREGAAHIQMQFEHGRAIGEKLTDYIVNKGESHVVLNDVQGVGQDRVDSALSQCHAVCVCGEHERHIFRMFVVAHLKSCVGHQDIGTGQNIRTLKMPGQRVTGITCHLQQ